MSNIRTILRGLVHARSFLNKFGNHTSTRPSTLSPVNGIFRSSSPCKFVFGARCFSSSGPTSHIVLEMPALSPTMNQGNIATWRKKEGDKINVGDVLCEIETDKATVEFESLEEGINTCVKLELGRSFCKNLKIHKPLDSTTCLLACDGIVSKMFLAGGVVGETFLQVPLDVSQCHTLGYLAKILAPEGSKDVLVGQPIAVTVEDPDEIKNVPSDISSTPEVKESKPIQELEHKGSSHKTTFNRISPSARLLITEYGLEASSLKASGPHGTLLKGDVLAAIQSGGVSRPAPKSSQEKASTSAHTKPFTSQKVPDRSSRFIDTHEDLPNSQIRKVIAKRLLESKHGIPHLYLSSDVILDPLLSFRNELKEKYNIKVSVNDIIIKAVALALRNVPEANAYWSDDKGEASLCNSIDISVAVATEKGLMTPIVRNADKKALSAISLEVKELAEKARAGKLAPNDYVGGTFSISNLGMYPVDDFYAIINPPQACILAVGRGNKVVEPVTASDGSERLAVVSRMSLNLSADHRVFNGQLGARFLSALSSNLSDIRRLIL